MAFVKRDEAEERLAGLDVITSPLRRLSREILTNIFDHSLDTDGFAHLSVPVPISQHHTPLSLGQICHSWRDTTLSTPRLWSSLRIELPQDIELEDGQKLVSLLHLWMERSRDALLKLDLTIYTPAGRRTGVRGASLRAVMATLLPHSIRWQDLRLDVPFGALKSLLKEASFATDLQVPKLQTFELAGGRGYESYSVNQTTEPPSHFKFDFSSACALRKLLLFDVGMLVAHETAFSWQFVNELNLVGMDHELSFDDCSAIFRRCSTLQRCRLSISNSTRPQQPGQPIILEKLEWLHISQHSLPGGGSGEIYHRLRCPSLTEVILEYLPKENEIIHRHHSIWTQNSITCFLSHSPLLIALQLWNMPLTEECLINVLCQTPSLTHLTVSGWRPIHWAGNLLLSRLSVTPDEDVLLKDLQSFSIESQICSLVHVREFIESRLHWWGDTLKFVRLCLPETRTTGRDWLRRLARYAEDGLMVEIVESRLGHWDSYASAVHISS